MSDNINKVKEIRGNILTNLDRLKVNPRANISMWEKLLKIELNVLDNKTVGLKRTYENLYSELFGLTELLFSSKSELAFECHELFGNKLLKLDPLSFHKPKTGNLRIGTIFGLEDKDIPRLKKDSLYFDKFAIWNNPELLSNPELQFLHDKDLLIILDHDNLFHNALDKHMNLRKNQPYKISIKNSDDTFLLPGMIKKLSADVLSSIENLIGIPYYLSDKEFQKDFTQGTTSCLSIVLKYLPVPDESVAWESILDFRNTPEVITAKKALINWQNKIDKESKSIAEITDEVDYLLSVYEQQLKLQKIKYHRSSFEIIVVGIAEVIDDLKSLKLKSAAEKLFSFNKLNVEIEQEKQNMQGKELAYLSMAREKFVQS